jgi:hypothetical protein
VLLSGLSEGAKLTCGHIAAISVALVHPLLRLPDRAAQKGPFDQLITTHDESVAMAEAVFVHEAKLRGVEVEIDSAGEFDSLFAFIARKPS